MNIEQRYNVVVGDFDRAVIVLVGCGGTGSHLALRLANLAHDIKSRPEVNLDLAFIDPDRVERKNVGRQNFFPAEEGANKAQALMWRYNRRLGLDIAAYPESFSESQLPSYRSPYRSPTFRNSTFRLLIGAVDNAAARRDIAEAVEGSDWWWLDCGNHEHSGQVVLGNRGDLTEPEIDSMGFCSGLPLPSVQHPELLHSNGQEAGSAESCAELVQENVQGLMVNQAIASYAAQYVYRLVVLGDLDIYATYIDLISGNAQSEPITKG